MATPGTLDPVLSLLDRSLRNSPAKVAFAYGALALGTAALAATLEGLFITENSVTWRGESYVVRPLVHNFSTLLDFALLNPLVIFCLLRGQQATALTRPVLGRLAASRWQAGICVLLAIALVATHYFTFLQGSYFDAVVAISASGERLVTVTGWVVFFWTMVFAYFLFMGAGNQLRYVAAVLRLTSDDLRYKPFHEDEAGGQRVLAEPALQFLWAMVWLLVILIVFAVYDYWIFDVPESKRVWSLTVYAAVVIPLFVLPLGRLNRLMRTRRSTLLAVALGEQTEVFTRNALGSNGTDRRSSLQDVSRELEALQRVRSTVLALPVWPLPVRTMVGSLVYFVGVLLPLVPRVALVLLSLTDSPWPAE